MFLVFLVSASTFLWSCDKAKDTVQPDALTATQVQKVKSGKDKEDKDNKYKTDKIGQYVSKDVQITGYEDGRERPTRPKYDAVGDLGGYSVAPCDPCEPGGGGVPTPPTSTFVSSEGLQGIGDIYNLQFIKDSDPLPSAEPGYTRLNADLNRGAGGKYIYLEFTRDALAIKSSHPNYAERNYPVTDIKAQGYSTGMTRYWYPPTGFANIYEHTCQCVTPDAWFDYKIIDLNDGSKGKYIYAYLSKHSSQGTPIKEVGILYGNSSSIQPPLGWVKVSQDLNEGAGGDYIYFCYKK
ncbi:hypothetical protein [Pontibacter pudoricolor]|uniref:hypothetical protein n=1 Tax=Pontibacter pudoricolor TaxID=2694930 RepID=UPI001391938F|nr:hypothetical protein [Pontibacter pudoricolor]